MINSDKPLELRSLRDQVRVITNALDYQLMRYDSSSNDDIVNEIKTLQLRLNKLLESYIGK